MHTTQCLMSKVVKHSTMLSLFILLQMCRRYRTLYVDQVLELLISQDKNVGKY